MIINKEFWLQPDSNRIKKCCLSSLDYMVLPPQLLFSFGNSIPSRLVWTGIECMVLVALPKRPINQFKPVQQSRQKALRAYCPDIYTVILALLFISDDDRKFDFALSSR